MDSSSDAEIVHNFNLAALHGELKRLKKLAAKLEKGEGNYPKLREYPGYIALHVAAGEGHTLICDTNLPGPHFLPNCPGHLEENGDTPLHYAIWKCHHNTAKLLIENGASMDISNNKGCTPLHFAASYGGGKDLLQLCLSKGADIEATSNNGTPLSRAAIAGDHEAVKFLLQNNAKIYPVNDFYIPHMFASHSSLTCLDLLVKAGVDINMDFHGETPLQIAAGAGKVEIIKYLLNAGANPNSVSCYLGLTPLEMAGVISKKEEAVALLLPITTPIPCIKDWSVKGVMKYAKSKEVMEKINATKKEFAQEAKSKAAEAFKKEEYLEAVNWYHVACKADPWDFTLYTNKSICFARLNKLRNALFAAKQCVMLKPNWPKAHYRVGETWMLMKNYEEAVNSFSIALKLDPNNLDICKALHEAREAGFAEMDK